MIRKAVTWPDADVSTRRSTTRLRRLLVAGWVCALALSGCGGAAAPTPDGFTRAATSDVTFAYPSDWRNVGTKGYPDGWKLVVESRKDGEVVAQAAVFQGLPNNMTDPVIAAEAALAMMQLERPDFRRLGSKAIDVPNATGARRVNFSYTAVNSAGKITGETVRGTDIVAVDATGNAVVVRVTRKKGTISDDIVHGISKTVAMKTG